MKPVSLPRIYKTPEQRRSQETTATPLPAPRPRQARAGPSGVPSPLGARTGVRQEGAVRVRVARTPQSPSDPSPSLASTRGARPSPTFARGAPPSPEPVRGAPFSPTPARGARPLPTAARGAPPSPTPAHDTPTEGGKGVTLFGRTFVGHRIGKPADKISSRTRLSDYLPIKMRPAGGGATKASSAATPQASEGRIILKDGRSVPALSAQAPAVQAAFLARHDPVQTLGLTDDSVFYRTMEKSWLQKSKDGKGFTLAGNPNSVAVIHNHLAVKDNPAFRPATFSSLPKETQASLMNDPIARIFPVAMRASNLPTPTLNVGHGELAAGMAKAYGRSPDHVVVEMTLGDLRRAGGGQVFFDRSALAGNSKTRALIVTLPAGKRVPVKVID